MILLDYNHSASIAAIRISIVFIIIVNICFVFRNVNGFQKIIRMRVVKCNETKKDFDRVLDFDPLRDD